MKVQVNKKGRNRVRRVKREVNSVSQSRFVLELPAPGPIEKIQQTINSAFGNVQDFLNFIMKRTQETYRLSQRLKELDLDSKKKEFQDVIKEVIKCIQEAAALYEKAPNSRGLPGWKGPIQQVELIVEEIEDRSNNSDLTLRDFLKVVLRAYIEESFIYYWLNDYIKRNLEDCTDRKSLIKAISKIVENTPKEEYKKTFDKLIDRMQLCIDNNGECLGKLQHSYFLSSYVCLFYRKKQKFLDYPKY